MKTRAKVVLIVAAVYFLIVIVLVWFMYFAPPATIAPFVVPTLTSISPTPTSTGTPTTSLTPTPTPTPTPTENLIGTWSGSNCTFVIGDPVNVIENSNGSYSQQDWLDVSCDVTLNIASPSANYTSTPAFMANDDATLTITIQSYAVEPSYSEWWNEESAQGYSLSYVVIPQQYSFGFVGNVTATQYYEGTWSFGTVAPGEGGVCYSYYAEPPASSVSGSNNVGTGWNCALTLGYSFAISGTYANNGLSLNIEPFFRYNPSCDFLIYSGDGPCYLTRVS